jgi:hypothetical protein
MERYGWPMSSFTAMIAGAGSGVVGLALMVVETIRVLNGSSLSGLNNALLFVGLALLAIGGALLVLAVMTDDTAVEDVETADTAASVAEPADDPA